MNLAFLCLSNSDLLKLMFRNLCLGTYMLCCMYMLYFIYLYKLCFSSRVHIRNTGWRCLPSISYLTMKGPFIYSGLSYTIFDTVFSMCQTHKLWAAALWDTEMRSWLCWGKRVEVLGLRCLGRPGNWIRLIPDYRPYKYTSLSA